MEFYHNPRCQKSRQALALLEEQSVDLEVRKYLEQPPTKKELMDLISKLGCKPEALLRKNEAIFKSNYKGKNFSDEEWIDIMVEHPKLIERPIFIYGDRAVVGRPPEKVLTLL